MLSISGVWLLALYPAINWFWPEKLPQSMRAEGGDFGQYYTGALVARYGLWSCLYPKANPNIYDCPPQFHPQISTRFFDESRSKERQAHWSFYPQVAMPGYSEVAPELSALCPQLQASCRYIYPPPLALLLWPLGFFNYHTAYRALWFPGMCVSLFGTGYLASRICRTLWKKSTYMEGWVALLPVIPTWLGSNMSTTLEIGNVSPLLGFLIAAVTYAWLRGWQITIGLGMIPLALFKGIGIFWCPLLLFKPVKWKTLGILAALTLLINGLTLYLGGTAVYQAFFSDTLPKANIPLGISLPGQLLTLFGIDLKGFFVLVHVALVGSLYWGYCRSLQTSEHSTHPSALVSTIAGTMAAFCLCNNVVWPHHYYTCYVMLPFSGWILWEGYQAKGNGRKFIFGMFALSILFWFDAVFVMKNSWLMESLKHHGLYSERIGQIRFALSAFLIMILEPLEFLFVLTLSYRRLFRSPSMAASDVPGAVAEPIRRVL